MSAEVITDFLYKRRAVVFVDRLLVHGPKIAEMYAKGFYKTNEEIMEFRPYVKEELHSRGVNTDGVA